MLGSAHAPDPPRHEGPSTPAQGSPPGLALRASTMAQEQDGVALPGRGARPRLGGANVGAKTRGTGRRGPLPFLCPFWIFPITFRSFFITEKPNDFDGLCLGAGDEVRTRDIQLGKACGICLR